MIIFSYSTHLKSNKFKNNLSTVNKKVNVRTQTSQSLVNGGCYDFVNVKTNQVISYGYTGQNNLLLTNNQGWDEILCLEYVGDNHYIINFFRNNSTVLDVEQGLQNDGASLIKYARHGGYNQQYEIVPKSSGQYQLLSVSSGKPIGLNQDGVLAQYSASQDQSQLWYLYPAIDAKNPSAPLVNGACFYMENQSNKSNLSYGNSSRNMIFTKNRGTNEVLCVELLTNNAYIVYFRSSKNTVLDNRQSLPKDGNSIIKHKRHGKSNQQFNVSRNDRGNYQFTCVCSGKSLGLDSNGRLAQFTTSQDPSQLWNLFRA